MTDLPPVRPAARVLVLDPEGRVLLFGARLVDLATPPGPVLYWYTPGGEVEPGEALRHAAARELVEEIGTPGRGAAQRLRAAPSGDRGVVARQQHRGDRVAAPGRRTGVGRPLEQTVGVRVELDGLAVAHHAGQ